MPNAGFRIPWVKNKNRLSQPPDARSPPKSGGTPENAQPSGINHTRIPHDDLAVAPAVMEAAAMHQLPSQAEQGAGH